MKMTATAAMFAAIIVSAGSAMAAPIVPQSNVPVSTTGHPLRNQQGSNQNLRAARRHVEAAIDELERDASDYGGHKEQAHDDLTQARGYLEQALDYRVNHNGNGNGSGVPPGNENMPVPVTNRVGGNGNGGNGGNGGYGIRNQAGSNANLEAERAHVEAAIDALNADRNDYGGFKDKAMASLQAAREQLQVAENFIHSPGVRNGGTGEGESAANLNYVNEHIQAAIQNLDGDRNDYGGHRVAAISDLQTASSDIQSALAYDRSHPGETSVNGGGVIRNNGGVLGVNPSGNVKIGQGQSNSSIMAARQHLENAIDALGRDAHDYGGFRVKAMQALQAARSQLEQAIQSR